MRARVSAIALVTTLLAACGGGGDDPAPAGNGGGGTTPPAALSCNTAAYQAGSVELPSSAQLAAYAGSYAGQEGAYGPNPGDPFVKSADATLVLGSDGSVSYKGTAYTPSSVCIDKAAGPYGTILYVQAGRGDFDISDKVDATLGSAWGISPVDGATIFTKGLK
ncbi:MAG: hypothetical protein QM722_07590 [Piscinibacter sp.]